MPKVMAPSVMPRLIWAMAVTWSFVWGATSCASLPAPAETWPLAPAVAFDPHRELTQSVLIERDKEQLRLVGRLQLDDRGLVMVAFTPLGQRLFTIEYTPQGLVLDRSVALPETVDLIQVLGDLQLVYWPIADLEDAFGPDWVIQESDGGRRLLHRGRLVGEVRHIGPRRIEIHALARRYVIRIETLTAGEGN